MIYRRVIRENNMTNAPLIAYDKPEIGINEEPSLLWGLGAEANKQGVNIY